jgi:hypothetical protein
VLLLEKLKMEVHTYIAPYAPYPPQLFMHVETLGQSEPGFGATYKFILESSLNHQPFLHTALTLHSKAPQKQT